MKDHTGSDKTAPALHLGEGDGLIVVDMQRDFLPGGALGVTEGDRIVPVLNRYIALFVSRRLPVAFTRDWHPLDHCSFSERGGPWPPHCIADSAGAEFAPGLDIPPDAMVISKGTESDAEAYSGFQGTALAELLRERGCGRVFVGGLATDYCVKATVEDALANGFAAVLLKDAVRPVDVAPADGERAELSMHAAGATSILIDALDET